MNELISFQSNLLKQISNNWHRYLYKELHSNERMLAIKGLRGVGKTTLLLQYLSEFNSDKNKGLYVSVDHPYFYKNTLFDLAGEWSQYDGRLLLIDEVHKYKNWSRELKLIYDAYPELKIIFTSSSALDIYRGESDLSRRVYTQVLHGLSFREFLSFKHNIEVQKYSLQEIIDHHSEITLELSKSFKPIPFFKSYLKEGYFPFGKTKNQKVFTEQLMQTINTVLETDLAYIKEYSSSNTHKIKKLLGVIAESVPYEPNISKIAQKIEIGRNTINQYLHHLEDAGILNLVYEKGKGSSQLQKPGKIYFENSSFAHAFRENANIGAIRETFFANQLINAGHTLNLSKKGDFSIDNKWIFEIGGKGKGIEQIRAEKNALLALDDLEHGFAHKIPLWLFGFLY